MPIKMVAKDVGWESYRDFCIEHGYGRHSDRPKDMDEAWWRIEALLASRDEWRQRDAINRGLITKLRKRT